MTTATTANTVVSFEDAPQLSGKDLGHTEWRTIT